MQLKVVSTLNKLKVNMKQTQVSKSIESLGRYRKESSITASAILLKIVCKRIDQAQHIEQEESHHRKWYKQVELVNKRLPNAI